MNKLWKLATACAIALALQACGGGGGGSTDTSSSGGAPQSCSIADQRQHVLDFMTNEYFWYQQMGTPDNNAATMDAYFQSLLFKPTDRFSFTETTAAFQQLFNEGTFTGYGYSLALTDTTPTLRVRTIEPQGPAYLAGLRRGDTIISIDGFTPAQILAGSAGSVSSEGIQRTFVVRDVSGNTKTIQATSATFPLTPVQSVTVLNGTRNGQPVKVGYLDYTQFVTYSLSALTSAVQSFVQQGASELVLDLRYNGGGDVATSRDLASLIAGARVAGQTFVQLRYNDKNQASNQTYAFNAPSRPSRTCRACS
jgi:C-terminal processing protease CtpA/Prc